MKKTINKILISITVIIVSIILILGLAFHWMEIEDHYGDLQEFYYKSRSGDLMILGNYRSIGIVDKTCTKLSIINSQSDTIDLFNWVYENSYGENSVKLYRTRKNIPIKELEPDKIILKIQNNEIKEINIKFNAEKWFK